MMRAAALLACAGVAHAASSTTAAETQTMADQIAEVVVRTAVSTMHIPILQDIVNKQPYTMEEVDGTVEAASAAALVARTFNDKYKSLTNLMDAAETAYSTSGSASAAQLAMDGSPDTLDTVLFEAEEERFFTDIYNLSSAFLPARGVASSSEVAYTAELDDTFALNAGFAWSAAADAPNDDELVWQFYASAEGMLRYHPAAEWDHEDTFDARLQPWYVRAVAGPKNLVVLVDLASSSTDYMLKAANAVLSGLHSDDWVQFVGFDSASASAMGVTGDDDEACFTGGTLVRATQANKDVWQAALDSHEAAGAGGGTGRVSAAVSLALEMIDTSLDNGLGVQSRCETTVLVLAGSGGSGSGAAGLDNPWDARFMTYSVGGGGDESYLKALACGHNGLFTRVGSTTDAYDVGLYYENMMVADVGTTYTYGRGLRADLMLAADPDYETSYWTMSEAVFAADGSGELLGVAGVDFTMYDLKDTLDALRFQQSFPILVNVDGDTLYHPLQTKYKELNLFDVGRDISNYEYFEGWDTNVRPYLMSGLMGEYTMTVDRALIKGDAVFEGMDVESIETTYFWQKVPNMPFYLAMTYAANDLSQRRRRASRNDMSESIYCTVADYSEDLADLMPEEAYATMNPRLVGLLDDEQVVFNVDNCAVDGVNFANCKNDTYCVEHGIECTGDCVCEPNRWPVGTISQWPCTRFAPMCFSDPTAAFTIERDADDTRQLVNFMNRKDGSENPEVGLSESCLTTAEITNKYFGELKNSSVYGVQDNTVWLYFGAASGSYSLFPGNSWGNGYDPTRRPWYSRATAYKGQYQHVVSTPYLDAGGGGLMNTFAEAVWEERECTPADHPTKCGEIVSDRVFGVSGWDMLYPDFDAFASVSTDGGCSTLSVLNHTAEETVPYCFLIDPAGLLLSHSDFLLSFDEAAAAGLAVETEGEVGTWLIENVFLGAKEPPLAQALVDAGFFTYRTDQLSETGQMLLNFYESNPDVLAAAGGVLEGTLDASSTCYVGTPSWKLSHINDTNIFLLVVDNYERHDTATYLTCEPVVAADATAVEDDTCAWSSAYVGRGRGMLTCSDHEKLDTYDYEALRASYAKCEVQEYIKPDEGVGGAIFIIAILVMVLIAGLSLALFVFRKKYVIKAASPIFCQLMCLGGILGCVFLLMFIGEPTDGTCHARQWFGGLAFVFLFSPLFAKTWRINKIFNNTSMKKMKITNKDLFKAVAAILCIDVFIQLLWSAIVNPSVVQTADENDSLVVYVGCDGDGFAAFATIHYIFVVCTVLFGVRLSWKTRNVQGEFNESTQIGAAIYNMFFMGAIIIPMVYGLDIDYEAQFVLIALGVLAVIVVTLLVLFVPKFMQLNKAAAEFETEHQHRTQATSAPSTHAGPGSKYSTSAKVAVSNGRASSGRSADVSPATTQANAPPAVAPPMEPVMDSPSQKTRLPPLNNLNKEEESKS